MKDLIIKKSALTTETLKIIKNIDDIFYNESELTFDWYLKRYGKNHNGYLLYDDALCVGYLVCVPIKKELYNLIIHGAFENDLNINHDMFVYKSKHNYISSIVILEKYRHLGFGNKLMEAMFQNNKGNFCALTITKEGYYLLKKYMKLEKKINDTVNVFSLENTY